MQYTRSQKRRRRIDGVRGWDRRVGRCLGGRTLRRKPGPGNRSRPLDFVLCTFLAGRMIKDDEPSRPMTLGSMRRNGVRGLQPLRQAWRAIGSSGATDCRAVAGDDGGAPYCRALQSLAALGQAAFYSIIAARLSVAEDGRAMVILGTR
jgi:hypothetical protein